MLMAHFAIRSLMHDAALHAEEDPDRLSFIHAVRVVRRKMAVAATTPPRLRKIFDGNVFEEILPERLPARRGRPNKRGVKQKMSGYPLRRRSDPPQPTIDAVTTIMIALRP